MYLIGSSKIKEFFPDFPRTPKDKDWAVDFKGLTNSEGVEYLYNPVLVNYIDTYGESPDVLYTVKMSHLFWDINWEKHEWDATWLRERGCTLIYPLFWKLYDYFNELHGKNKRSDLKMTASQFFNNALDCPYDHDWLHTLLNPYPTFNKVLKDGEEVDVSEDKFQYLSEQEKEDLVREEVEIMAFERFSKLNFRMAYGIMLKKFIISHAPIWEAIWILENYKRLSRARHNFIKILNEKINERGDNIIKRPSRSVQKQRKVLSV